MQETVIEAATRIWGKKCFVKRKCQYKDHFCNGRYIGKNRELDKKPCRYFDKKNNKCSYPGRGKRGERKIATI